MKYQIFLPILALLTFFVTSCEEERQFPGVSDSVPLLIAIQSDVCCREGESLTVYEPNNNDFQIFDEDNYSVEWKVGNVIVASGSRIECVCGNSYKVVVTDLATGETAQAKHTPIECADGLQKNIESVEITYLPAPPLNISEADLYACLNNIGDKDGGCSGPTCETLIAELRPYYQKTANETGEAQAFCVACCQDGVLVYALVIVTPNNIPESHLQKE